MHASADARLRISTTSKRYNHCRNSLASTYYSLLYAQAPLLPAAHDALAVGLDAALGGPIGGGAYDLAQKCDVEIWVAAAALRAVGGDAAAARLFVDECPGLLSAPGPDDDAVAPFKRGDVIPPAPRRKPPRRRGLSLPPQPM